MQATVQQKKIIHTVVPRDIKEEYVQWATEDVKKISTNDLTFDQANKILEKFNCTPHKAQFLAVFDKKNPRHTKILSILIEMRWRVWSAKYQRFLANMDKLNEWMHSDKCPVKGKALTKMNDDELSKIIFALEKIALGTFK
jgi:hypothetical protein